MTPAPPSVAQDRSWMEQALALGALGEGSASPNPRVGCLLVRDGRPVGSGFHRAQGQPHAEAVAVARAGDRVRGATAYVSLEPCAHQGLTPPCVDLLVASGVRRVVAALQDPNPRVDGRGFAALRRAGVEVEVGLLADEATRLNRAFLQHHRAGRPLVTIKAAASLDGVISARGGCSQWITGGPARRFAHRLRFGHDALLVGAGTLRADDPRLTVRLDGVHAPRLRVVLTRDLDCDPGARVFEGASGPRPRIYTAVEASREREARFAGRADVVRVAARDGWLDLRCVLADLAAQGIQSVMVEGGARTLGAFLEAGLADRAALFVARRFLGAGGARPLIDTDSVSEPALGWRLVRCRQVALGGDQLLLGRIRFPEREE
jgi:diaminohydroxyphosphoribosylaminopyrimidine deaminase/5-amino-6-(5-phosphoribosylamino)uracil reductase